MTAATESSRRRHKTAMFASGRGQYVADLTVARVHSVVFVRSRLAHARLNAVDPTAALRIPGVVAVLTGADLGDMPAPPCLWRLEGQNESDSLPLAVDRVRYVGEPVAAVVATTETAAASGADAVVVHYDPLPAVVTVTEALAPGAPRLFDHWPDNVVVRRQWQVGDVPTAMAAAAVVIDETFTSGRVHPCSIETRGVVAEYDAAEQGVRLATSTQSVHQVRAAIAQCLRLPENRVRVTAPDVGGSFGMKACPCPEELVLALLALRLRLAVRWIETRREAFVASVHGRDARVHLRLGLDTDGRILGLEAEIVLDKGAEPYSTSIGTAWITGATLTGPYRVPAVDIRTCGVVTNKTPTGAYRGFGQPEANFAMERALDLAAQRLALDRAELRRRNFVPPEAMPCPTPTGIFLDSGRYAALLDLALEAFDYPAALRRELATRGARERVGIGLACYTEVTNFGPSTLTGAIGVDSGGFDITTVRMEPSGHVRLFTGQTPMGQGIEEVLADLCARELTVPVDDIVVVHGDTLTCAYTAYASGGSRGAGIAGSSTLLAARRLSDKLRRIGAHLLGVGVDEVELARGQVRVIVAPANSIPITEVARAAYRAASLPAGVEPGLEERSAYDPPSLAVSYGTLLVEVRVDTETGAVQLQRMLFAHDCGPQMQPAMVEGQVVGGVVQGIGATLFERLAFSPEGEPLSLSLQDYWLPTAADVPPITLLHLETPSPFSVTGAKGVGESGTIPTPAAIVNALQRAVGGASTLCELPVFPDRLLRPDGGGV